MTVLSSHDLASVVGGETLSPTAQEFHDLSAQFAKMRAAAGCAEEAKRENSQKAGKDCLQRAADQLAIPLGQSINRLPLE